MEGEDEDLVRFAELKRERDYAYSKLRRAKRRCQKANKALTGHVRETFAYAYRVIDEDQRVYGCFSSCQLAREAAEVKWPDGGDAKVCVVQVVAKASTNSVIATIDQALN
jgi:hypothetical protein